MDEIEKMRSAIAAKQADLATRLADVEKLVWERLHLFAQQVPNTFYVLPLSDYIYYSYYPYSDSGSAGGYKQCTFQLHCKRFQIRSEIGTGLTIKVNDEVVARQPVQGTLTILTAGSWIDELNDICRKLPLVIENCNRALSSKKQLQLKNEREQLREALVQQARRLGIDVEDLRRFPRATESGKVAKILLFIVVGIVVLLLLVWLK